MEVRITFRSEIYLEGKDMAEISRKWDSIELFSKEANEAYACEIELNSVEDAETCEDVMTEFIISH